MALVTLTSGKSFESPPEMPILHAAALERISIPYSCKTGRCSTCKCKVISGVTRALRMEFGLTEDERESGWILSCVRVAESDVSLEVDDLGEIALPAAKTHPCRIDKFEHLGPDVVRVFLRLPPDIDFSFIPGQYIQVIGPNGIRRSYSLANASFAEKLLELHIRAVPGGLFSDYWFKRAKQNDLLRLHGPLGTFFLRETAGIDLIFLATGTGIAPIKAMLESLSYLPPVGKPNSVRVLWGGRKSDDFYLNIADIPVDKTYVPVQSRPRADWTGARGYIQDVLLDAKPDLSNAAVYACGSNSMIHGAKARLTEAGLQTKCFYFDAFVSSGSY